MRGESPSTSPPCRREDPITSTANRNSLDRATAIARAAKLDDLEQEIRARAPRPAARTRVSLTAHPTRSSFQTQMRIAGPRDDVLDFTAALYDEIRGMIRPDGTLPLSVQAIESESSEHLQLLLSREMYEA